MSIQRPVTFAFAMALLLVPLAACSSDDDPPPPASSPAAAYPATVGSVTIATAPERIVSLSPTATEVLFAIGAGDRIVAVSTSSTYPDKVPAGDLDAFEPDLQALASKKPDLVITSVPIKGAASLGVPVIVHESPASVEEAYEQIRQIGAATDRAKAAEATIQKMKDEIARVVASQPKAVPPVSYYFEVDPAYSSVTSKTFMGDLLGQLGLQNIADTAPGGEGGRPQLSADFIVAASPELVVLADVKCCWQTPAAAAARSGWDSLRAVGSGAVVSLDDDVASTWGPRAVALLDPVAQAAAKATASR